MSFERRWRLADVLDLRILLDSSRLVQGNGYWTLHWTLGLRPKTEVLRAVAL